MAATFEVETGTASSTANSYASVAFADAYHENFGNPSAWSSLSDAEKEAALRAATRYLDARYRGQWKGLIVDRRQRLSWPRQNVELADGFYYEHTEIPEPLKEACSMLALEHVNAANGLMPNLSAGTGTVKKEKNKLGELEEEVEYMGGAREHDEFALAEGVLAPLLAASGGVGTIRRG